MYLAFKEMPRGGSGEGSNGKVGGVGNVAAASGNASRRSRGKRLQRVKNGVSRGPFVGRTRGGRPGVRKKEIPPTRNSNTWLESKGKETRPMAISRGSERVKNGRT